MQVLTGTLFILTLDQRLVDMLLYFLLKRALFASAIRYFRLYRF
jgi:hypothetical protein